MIAIVIYLIGVIVGIFAIKISNKHLFSKYNAIHPNLALFSWIIVTTCIIFLILQAFQKAYVRFNLKKFQAKLNRFCHYE